MYVAIYTKNLNSSANIISDHGRSVNICIYLLQRKHSSLLTVDTAFISFCHLALDEKTNEGNFVPNPFLNV